MIIYFSEASAAYAMQQHIRRVDTGFGTVCDFPKPRVKLFTNVGYVRYIEDCRLRNHLTQIAQASRYISAENIHSL